MPLLGAHMSIAGGVDLAVLRGAEVGCEVIQIFDKSSNQWRAKPLAADEIERFRRFQVEKRVPVAAAHACYLINLASPAEPLWRKSIAAFGEEIDRCDALGVPNLVLHPGSHTGSGEEAGIRRIAQALNRLFAARPGQRVRVLLENSAGMGSSIGHRFEHLRAILDRLDRADRAGVCFDTCHAFAAGYDIRTRGSYERVMKEFDATVSIGQIRLFHLNDCKQPLGCRVDRHEHIGKGHLGKEAFRCLLADPRLRAVPMVLETPKGEDSAEDRANLRALRLLRSRRNLQ